MAPKIPASITTSMDGELMLVQPVKSKDTKKMAALLLEHADKPEEIRTVTNPRAWIVPTRVAEAAGLID